MHNEPREPAPVTVRGFGSDLSALAEELAEQWNSDQADTLALIAEFAADSPGASSAEIVELSPSELVLAIAADGGEQRLSIQFAQNAVSIEELQGAFMGLLSRAREKAGDTAAQTGIEREIARTRNLPTYVTRVVRTRTISPLIREITFQGGLEDFQSIGPDQFVYVLAEKPGQKDIIRAGTTMAQLLAAPPSQRPAAAYYTVRRHRPEAGELDLWFVLHDHPTGMSGWAERAQPVDPAAFWGPRSSFEDPEGASELLLFGDETALPAICAILESSEIPAHVVVETVDESHTFDLVNRKNLKMEWVFRGATPAAQSKQLLHGVQRACAKWGSGTFAFGAAEATPTREVRRHLRGIGADARALKLVPYWNCKRTLNP